MKVFAIYDAGLDWKDPVGYLFHYERSNSFIIELNPNLSEWEAPLLFSSYVKKGIYTIPKESSILWVRERVIPSGRQNIGLILKNHKMNEYDEMKLLLASKGKCSQDQCYIKEIRYDEVPQTIKERSRDNISECFVSDDFSIICLFDDNTVRKIDLRKIAPVNEKVCHVLKNRALFESVKVGVGGYSITFNDSIEVDKRNLIEKGKVIDISAQDFYRFVSKNTVDTGKVCDMLECTKQNVAYLVKKERLKPIKNGLKENIFFKGNVWKNMWD